MHGMRHTIPNEDAMKEEPQGPYVYQPFGVFDKHYWKCGRIYGVAGVDLLARIDGLTKDEAHAVCDAIKALRAATPEAKTITSN